MSSSFSTNVYSDIQQWLNMQQQLDISGQPSTMTAAQRKAVKDLHQLIKPRLPVTEPEIGRQDWIGLLNRYRQAKPDPHGVRFTDEAVEDHPAPLRWHCYCLIAEHPQPFPCEARGVDPDVGVPPSFAKKQTAKHYAAKCAVEWLVERGLMPTKFLSEISGAAALRASLPTKMTRPYSPLSVSSAPDAKRQKLTSEPVPSPTMDTEQGGVRPTTKNDGTTSVEGVLSAAAATKHVIDTPTIVQQPPRASTSSNNTSTSTSSGGTPIVPPSEPRTSPGAAEEGGGGGGGGGDVDEDGKKKPTAQVAELCTALGIGAPRYEVWSDPENPGYFSARPVFHSTLEAGHFPHGTGHVEHVYGRNNAKELVAQHVLAVLRKIKQEREVIKRELMGNLGPTVG